MIEKSPPICLVMTLTYLGHRVGGQLKSEWRNATHVVDVYDLAFRHIEGEIPLLAPPLDYSKCLLDLLGASSYIGSDNP